MSQGNAGKISEGNGLEEQWRMDSAEPSAAARQVGESVKDEASVVADEIKSQTWGLVSEAANAVREQAEIQQQRLADGMHSLSDQFDRMCEAGEQGFAPELARKASEQADGVARWLDDREPGDLVEEVKTFARNRPGAFISIAVAAGIVAGRLVRSAASRQG